MINYRFILLGVLVGILSTIGFQELSNRDQPAHSRFNTSNKTVELENMKNISSGSFLGVSSLDDRDEDYIIAPRDHPLQQMKISKRTAIHSTNLNINIQDNNNTILLEDVDFDGVWDQRLVVANDTRYLYGKKDGFPVYIQSRSNEVVRIDGRYHDLHEQGGRKFVIRDGDKLEVDFSDIDHLKLTLLLDQENDSSEQQYTEVDLQHYEAETSPSGMPLLPALHTDEMDDQLLEEQILPLKEN
jgi:hypothetical protein